VVLCQLESGQADTELLERGSVYVAAELESVPNARVFSARPYLIGSVVFARTGRMERAPDIKRVTERVASEIDGMDDLSATIAVGGEVATVWELSKSFEEALSALDEKPELTGSRVIWFNSLATDDHGYLLSTATVMGLTQALRNGRAQEVGRIFDSILHANFERTRVSPEAAGVLVRELWVNLVKTAHRLARGNSGRDNERPSGLPVDLPTSIAPLPPSEQLEAIRRHYDSLARSQASQENEHRSTLIADAKAYLRDHYADPNVTLSSVAEVLGVSSEHLSRTFSKVEHTSFHVYLGLLRINRAKELIAEAPERVSSVYAAVGYSNRATFRRAFQSYEGLTAVQYARHLRSRSVVKNRRADQ
jgi:AraC-like DNA-binding protein